MGGGEGWFRIDWDSETVRIVSCLVQLYRKPLETPEISSNMQCVSHFLLQMPFETFLPEI